MEMARETRKDIGHTRGRIVIDYIIENEEVWEKIERMEKVEWTRIIFSRD